MSRFILTEAQVRALFLLADIPVLSIHELANQYCGAQCCPDRPWWLVKTHAGLITLGPRKRVYSIDWSDTPVRATVTSDNVTMEPSLVHAWTLLKALGQQTHGLAPNIRRYFGGTE